MNSCEWQNLSDEVKNKILSFHCEQPIKLGSLAKSLGITVKSSTLPVGISGEIKRDDDNPNGYVIRINRHENKKRQRFTLAHEIAHFLLHREFIGDGLTDDVLYRSHLSDKKEHEANRLAADILMPWPILREELQALKDVSTEEKIKQISEKLEVSMTALNIRLGRI